MARRFNPEARCDMPGLMMDTTKTLRDTILRVVQKSALQRIVQDVAVEPDFDEDGDEFLRVLVTMKTDDPKLDDQLESLLESIEVAVLDIDSRYPSVRFLDAA